MNKKIWILMLLAVSLHGVSFAEKVTGMGTFTEKQVSYLMVIDIFEAKEEKTFDKLGLRISKLLKEDRQIGTFYLLMIRGMYLTDQLSAANVEAIADGLVSKVDPQKGDPKQLKDSIYKYMTTKE